MKSIYLFIVSLALHSCGSNNEGASTKSADQTTSEAAVTTGEQGKGVTGEWEQANTVLDQNGNNLLEDAERQKPMSTKIGSYYLKFNSDGTCLVGEMKFEGTYELKDDGKEQTILIQTGDPQRLRIKSLKSDEMVLMPSGAPGTFLIYKRIE
jgi:ABC-type enterochelin transport system substrate-binding protein